MSTSRTAPAPGAALQGHDLLEMLYYMRLQRAVEDRGIKLYYQGRIPGTTWMGTGLPSGAVATPLKVSGDGPVPIASKSTAASRPEPDAPATSPVRVSAMSMRPTRHLLRERDRGATLPHEAALLHRAHPQHRGVVGQRDGDRGQLRRTRNRNGTV